MAYNTNPIITDVDGNPISQYYNPATDSYEPVEGSNGGNKVIVENNDLSLVPILDKLNQLTGTVLDESYRIANEIVREDNEVDRIELYNDLLIELTRIEQITEQVPQSILDEIQVLRDMDMLIRNNDLDGIIEDVIPLDAELLGGNVPSHYATKQSLDEHKAEMTTQLNGKVSVNWSDAINLPLVNGWTGNLSYKYNDLGMVHLYGTLTPGTIGNNVVIAEYILSTLRPNLTCNIPVISGVLPTKYGLDLLGAGRLRMYGSIIEELEPESDVKINYIYCIN